MFIFKYSKRPNTAALAYEDQIAEEEKTRRLIVVQEKQRAIQIRRNSGYVGKREEVHVEGFNKATSQWIGRTSQNKTLNFTDSALSQPDGETTLVGDYMDVLVTRAGPNSLAGESVRHQASVQ
jgi:tRNA-2-methylthio-N6-dimethylallyladenosine synthase